MGEPLLCRLGFHKWQNYGKKVQVFWQEPKTTIGEKRAGVRLGTLTESHHETVYEGHECKRCGMKLRRKFVTNADGTPSCVGWEPDTEETDKETDNRQTLDALALEPCSYDLGIKRTREPLPDRLLKGTIVAFIGFGLFFSVVYFKESLNAFFGVGVGIIVEVLSLIFSLAIIFSGFSFIVRGR